MISRGAPEFWQLYRELPPEIQAATRKAYQLFSASQPATGTVAIGSTRLVSARDQGHPSGSRFRRGEDWLWFWIGTHKEFDRQFPA